MQDLSAREVSRRAGRHGLALTHSTLNRLYVGEAEPRAHHLRAIAAALGVSPDTFAEYRLWEARHLFEPYDDGIDHTKGIGWDRAMTNLDRFEEMRAKATRERAPVPVAPHEPRQIAGPVDQDGDEVTNGHS